MKIFPEVDIGVLEDSRYQIKVCSARPRADETQKEIQETFVKVLACRLLLSDYVTSVRQVKRQSSMAKIPRIFVLGVTVLHWPYLL